MNWWMLVLIISGVWVLIGFVAVVIILKFKKVKSIVQKVVYHHLKWASQHNAFSNIKKSSVHNYQLVTNNNTIEDALLFLQFKYEVVVATQNNQQMVNWSTNINYCHLFNHNHHFSVINILNFGIKHHLSILKPLHCLKKIFDKCHSKSNDKHYLKPKVQKTNTNNFNENSINRLASTANSWTQNVHHNAL